MQEIQISDESFTRGQINTIERFQNVIKTWNNTSEELKDNLVSYFKETDPLNSIYLMAFSGARGNFITSTTISRNAWFNVRPKRTNYGYSDYT